MSNLWIPVNLLNNREIATATWLLIGLALRLSQNTIRESMLGVVRTFFHHKLLATITCMALYTSAVVFTLFLLEFWNATILKDTIFWFCFF